MQFVVQVGKKQKILILVFPEKFQTFLQRLTARWNNKIMKKEEEQLKKNMLKVKTMD